MNFSDGDKGATMVATERRETVRCESWHGERLGNANRINLIAEIGSIDSVTFTIGIIVDGYYTRDRAIDNTLVTVSKPIENSVTGGG